MTLADMDAFEKWFDRLSLPEQLGFVERLIRRLRHRTTTADGDFERQMQEMANDPDIQRVLAGGDVNGGQLNAAG